MTIKGRSPYCRFCKHFDMEAKFKHPNVYKCMAFPNKIPEEILDLSFDHREPYPGDHEFRFEKVDIPMDYPALEKTEEGFERSADSLKKAVDKRVGRSFEITDYTVQYLRRYRIRQFILSKIIAKNKFLTFLFVSFIAIRKR